MKSNATARAEQSAASGLHQQPSAHSELQSIVEALQSKLRLAIIFGGNKTNPGSVLYQSQNTRSWKSYETVAEDIATSLRRSGFRNVELLPEDMFLAERLRARNI